jgi:alkylation response protein AidB-like acyl-CoA dehydrogenase
MGQWAIEYASNYARERRVFDRPIGQNQAVAHPLAQAWADASGRAAGLQSGLAVRSGLPCGAEANAAKLLGGDAGSALRRRLQTLGGFGYSREFHVERLWREVRLFRIAPITQEMVLNYLSSGCSACPSY